MLPPLCLLCVRISRPFEFLSLFYQFMLFIFVSQGAILTCARLQRAHMEGASLRGCNFEDPTGTRAHLEGKNTAFLDS